MILAGIDRRPTNLAATAHALRTVADRLYALGDARGAFPDIYGMITDRVAEQNARADGIFWERSWVSRVSGRFCERYLDTLEWSLAGHDQDCAAWRIAYRCATQRTTVPFQDVMLGLSAHINYDLALGMAQTITDFGHAQDAAMRARYKHDHDVINVILDEAIPAAYTRVATAHRCPAARVLWGPGRRALVHPVTMRVLAFFRATVWHDVIGLLDARDEIERRRVIAAMDRRSGRYAKMMTAGNTVFAKLTPFRSAAA